MFDSMYRVATPLGLIANRSARHACLLTMGALLLAACGGDEPETITAEVAAVETAPTEESPPEVLAEPSKPDYPVVTKRRLGPNINTEYGEQLPIAADDGDTLWFTRTNYPDPTLRVLLEQQFDEQLASCGTDPAALEARMAEIENLPEDMKQSIRELAAADKGKCPEIEAARDRLLADFDTKRHAEQVYQAVRNGAGEFAKAQRVGPPFNESIERLGTLFGRSVTSAAPDRNTLLLVGAFLNASVREDKSCLGPRSRTPTGEGNEAEQIVQAMDSFFSHTALCLPLAMVRRDVDGWKRTRMLRTEPFDYMLSATSAALAPDGLHIIFAATLGTTHVDDVSRLYHSQLDTERNIWSSPRPLDAIAGDWDDTAPFIGPDGQTLFFASDRPGGEGGIDLYVARRTGDSWAAWSEPENLGPYINTANDDTSISVDASGVYAFMSSGVDEQQDIYEFHLPVNLSPAPLARIRGRILIDGAPLAPFDSDGDGNGQLSPMFGSGSGSGGGGDTNLGGDLAGGPQGEARVQFFRQSDSQMAGVAGINPGNGAFAASLGVGQRYSAYVEAPGFAGIGNIIDLSTVTEATDLSLELDVAPLEIGAKIRLNNIYFDIDKAVLRPESETELRRLVGILERYPAMTIEIAGHTDSQNEDDYNMALSTNRSNAVVDYLIAAGIAAARLRWQGYGETEPVASNDTKAGRQLNRRVEFEILSM